MPGMRRREFVSAVRRRGCGVADGGEGAAAGDAGDRFPQQCFGRRVRAILVAFKSGLKETGYVEGQNVAIEYRWAEVNTIGCQRWRRSGSPAGGRDRRYRWHECGSGGSGGDADHPYRFLTVDPVRMVLSPAWTGRAAT